MRRIAYAPEVLRSSTLSWSPKAQFRSLIAGSGADSGSADDYFTKLVKYVPAETVAFVCAVSATPLSNALMWVVFWAAAVGSVVYIAIREPLPWFTYILTLIAAFLWIIGTTNYGEILFHLSYAASRVMMAIGIFLIPGIDELATKWYRREMAQ